ncbi:MFS transporter [Luteolibacter pohnpeiensis]|uniref:MFS transporter n=1 Tax=Luteolibacter pohnpeiensis TaxID=454153 RepID=A0A934S4J9_9BACT|nr:MFS transporter [Luteolibacter pohnpeiensis]MBK1881100.1 MFS transporter [Luteolibacter pohnpeiensis]
MRNDPERGSGKYGTFVWIWLAFFFQGMSSGCWMPALTNIMRSLGLSEWVAIAFMVAPFAAMVSPLIGGALADQRVAANRLFAYSSLLGSIFLALAFLVLHRGWNAWWFIGLLGLYSLACGPMWGYLATVSFTHLAKSERSFPFVRIGATLGWVSGGLLTGLVLHADSSPLAGYAGALGRLAAGVIGLCLPYTPPLGKSRSWRSLLGFDAFTLLKQRDHCVFFVVTALFSIPLAAFYMFSPEQLKAMGDTHPTATMAVAQASEIVALLIVGSVMARLRVKVVLLMALGLSALRFSLSAYAGLVGVIGWHILGIGLHGVCYTFYFITAQVFLDRRVDAGMRGQAQGLLAFMSSGFGPFIGARVCGWLRNHFVEDGVGGWFHFWGILASMIAVCFVIFAVMYRGLGVGGNSQHIDQK